MENLLLHRRTKTALNGLLQGMNHAIILSGPEGAGKTTIAHELIREKLGIKSLDNYPYYTLIEPEKNSISIDQIRNLQRFLQLKTTGDGIFRRGAIIRDAHLMTIEAQNALLKSLEEPPADTLIVLTAPTSPNIRQTIYSRVQQVDLLPVSTLSAEEYFTSKGYKKTDIDKAFAISGGYVGVLSALLSENTEHPLFEQIARVKELVEADNYERLKSVDEIAKNKENLSVFMQACRLVCTAALSVAANKGNTKMIQHWHKALSAVYDSESALEFNPNTKLLLTNLMLNL